MTALACGGVAGCGSSSGNSPGEDAGGDVTEGGTEGGEDAMEEMSPPGEDAGKDAPADVIGKDSPVDSPVDAPKDGPSSDASDSGGKDAGEGGTTGAVASFSTNPISLGAGNCGGAAVTGTLSIKNTGTANLTVTDTIAGNVFSVSPATLTVTPGSTGTLTISATVPQASTAGTALSGTLNLTTNDPTHASAAISLSVTPTGATLAWSGSTTAANFPTTAVGKAASPISLTLINTGNAAATVTYAAPASPFTLTPNTGAVPANNGTLALSAGFTPPAAQSYTGTSALTVTGSVCGTIPANVKTLAFSGTGGTGNVTGWPSTVHFGDAECGGAAPGLPTGDPFTLTNSGAVPVTVTGVSWSNAAGFTTSAAVGQTIPANGTLQITVNAPAVPYPTTSLNPISSTLTITTDAAPGDSHSIVFDEQPHGAMLSITAPAGFGTFNTTPVGSSANQNFSITNKGNEDWTGTVTASDNSGNAQFTTNGGTCTPNSSGDACSLSVTGVPVTGGTSSDQLVYTPINNQAATGTLTIFTATGSVCSSNLPNSTNLYGTGQNGGISQPGGALQFYELCQGSAAAAQQVVFHNTGNLDFNWTASLKTGTQFSISSPGNTCAAGKCSGTSLANGANSTTIVVTPNAIGKAGYADITDVLTVTTTIAPNDPAYTWNLTLTPQGDALEVTQLAPPFPDTEEGKSSDAKFTIINHARSGPLAAPANVTVTVTSGPFALTPSMYPVALPPGGSSTQDVQVQFNAPNLPVGTYKKGYSADIGISIPSSELANSCQDFTTAETATANDIAPGPVVNVTALYFGQDGASATNPTPNDNCGSGCGAHPNYSGTGLVGCGNEAGDLYIDVSNLSTTQSFNITGVKFAKGTNFTNLTTIPPTGLTVAASSSQYLQIHPVAIPTTSSVTADGYADSVTISTDSPTVPTLGPIKLHMGAYGAIVTNKLLSTTWNFGTTPYGGTSAVSFGLVNTGNEAVTVQLSGLSQGVFGLQDNTGGTSPGNNTAVQNQVTLPGQEGTFSFEGTFTPNAPNSSFTDQGTLSVTAGGGTAYFCAPLDPSWGSTISLTGSSGSSSITFSPSGINFPTASCSGSEPAAQSVTFTNSGNAVSYTATLLTGSSFSITSGANGTIAGSGGTATITVNPTASLYGANVVPGIVTDTLQVQIQGGSTYNVPVSMLISGGVVSWGGGGYYYTYAYQGTPYDQPSVYLQNGGNASVAGSVTFSAPSWAAPGINIGANSSQSFLITYTGPNVCGSIQYGTADFTPSPDNLCAPVTGGAYNGGISAILAGCSIP